MLGVIGERLPILPSWETLPFLHGQRCDDRIKTPVSGDRPAVQSSVAGRLSSRPSLLRFPFLPEECS